MNLFIGEPVTNTTAGLIGEHIAASAILQRGWGVAHSPQDGWDLIAVQGREIYRVQVKACALSLRKSRGKPSKKSLQFIPGVGKTKRMPTREDYDIMCLVSSETRACLFMPIWEVKQAKITKSVFLFTPENEVESWEHTIEDLRNDRPAKPPSLRNY